jgi:hypothetical protein
MLLHARNGSGERRKVALDELVVEALSLAYHGARAQGPNLNLTPRAADNRNAPTGAPTAATNDCWPNLGLRGPGVFVALRIARWRFRRARRSVFCLARGSGNSDHSPTSSGI